VPDDAHRPDGDRHYGRSKGRNTRYVVHVHVRFSTR
jgi:hypothetical protein